MTTIRTALSQTSSDEGGEVRFADAMRFLEALFGSAQEGLIEVRQLDGRQTWFDIMAIEQAASFIAEAEGEACVGVGVRSRRSGKAEDVLGVTALWADLGADPEAWARFPLEPSIVVDSGHGSHVYYLTTGLLTDRELVARHVKALQVALHGDDNAIDLARVMRVPGGMNHKEPMEPAPVRLLDLHSDRRYELE